MKQTQVEEDSIIWKKSSSVLWVFENTENYNGHWVYRLRRAIKEG